MYEVSCLPDGRQVCTTIANYNEEIVFKMELSCFNFLLWISGSTLPVTSPDQAVFVLYFNLLGNKISAVKIRSMLIAVLAMTFIRNARKSPISSNSSNNK